MNFKPIVLLGVAIVLTTLIIVLTLKYLSPLVLALIIAIIIDPIVHFLERKTRIDRGLIVIIVLTALFSLMGYISIIVIARFTFELGKFINTFPKYYIYFNMLFDKISSYLVYFSTRLPEEVIDYLRDNVYQILSSMTGSLSNFYSFMVNKIGKVPNLFIKALVLVMFVFLFTYFLSKDKKRIIEVVRDIIPDSLQEKVKTIQIELFLSFVRLIKAQVILVLISTLITISGFYVLKVDYALILGIVCGLLDMMPLFGPSLIFIPWIIFLFIFGDISGAFSLLTLYVIVIVSRQLLQAKIIGKNLGIDPLLTLVSIYLGIELYGVLGLFVGPMVIVIVRALTHSGVIPPLNKSK